MVAITLLLVFGVFPALLGYVGYVKSHPKRLEWYFRGILAVESWRTTECALAAFIVCTAVLYVEGFLTKAGLKFGLIINVALLLLSSVTAFIYLCCYWKIPTLFKRHGGLFKTSVGAVAIGVATISKSYSDSAIAELTGLPPQSLPGAQILLTFILTPTIWFFGLSMLFGYLSLPVMVVMFCKALYADLIQDREADNKWSSLPRMGALMAVALFSLMSLTAVQKIASKNFYELRLKQAIAFASFHLPITYCGIPDVKGVRVLTLSDEKAAVAIPEGSTGYSFDVVSCKPKIKSESEMDKLLKKN